MPYKINYIKDKKIVEVFYYGHVTGEDINNATVESLAVQIKHNVILTLVNTTEVTKTSANIIDVHFIPEKFYEQTEVSRKKVIAVVESEIPHVRTIVNDFFNACFNRGWKIKSFSDKNSAMKWLEEVINGEAL